MQIGKIRNSWRAINNDAFKQKYSNTLASFITCPNINSEAYIKIALAAEMALQSSHNSYSTRITRTCKTTRFSSSSVRTLLFARHNFFLSSAATRRAALINFLIRTAILETDFRTKHYVRLSRVTLSIYSFIRFLVLSSMYSKRRNEWIRKITAIVWRLWKWRH